MVPRTEIRLDARHFHYDGLSVYHPTEDSVRALAKILTITKTNGQISSFT
jgi:hypothetical protein